MGDVVVIHALDFPCGDDLGVDPPELSPSGAGVMDLIPRTFNGLGRDEGTSESRTNLGTRGPNMREGRRWKSRGMTHMGGMERWRRVRLDDKMMDALRMGRVGHVFALSWHRDVVCDYRCISVVLGVPVGCCQFHLEPTLQPL